MGTIDDFLEPFPGYEIPGHELEPVRPTLNSFEGSLADSIGGNQFENDPEAAKKDALRAAMRNFGTNLLAAGLSPDYRTAAQNIGRGLAGFAPTFEQSMRQSRADAQDIVRQEREDLFFDIRAEGAELDLQRAREDRDLRETLRRSAQDSIGTFDSIYKNIVPDDDIHQPERESFAASYKFMREAYLANGSVEAGAQLMQLLQRMGEKAGRSEETNRALFDSLKEGAVNAGYPPTDKGIKDYTEMVRKKVGLTINNAWLENQLRDEQIRGERLRNDQTEQNIGITRSLEESGALAPPGYTAAPTGKGGIRYLPDRTGATGDLDQTRLASALGNVLGDGIPMSLENINANNDALRIVAAIPGIEIDSGGKLTASGYTTLVQRLMNINSAPSSPALPGPTGPPRVGTPEAQKLIDELKRLAAPRNITDQQAIDSLVRKGKIVQ